MAPQVNSQIKLYCLVARMLSDKMFMWCCTRVLNVLSVCCSSVHHASWPGLGELVDELGDFIDPGHDSRPVFFLHQKARGHLIRMPTSTQNT